MKLTVKGLDEIIARFPEHAEDIKNAADEALEASCREIANRASMTAPVDTGRLAMSFDWERLAPLVWTVWNYMDYALYQEVGWYHHISGRHIAGKWFLTDALYSKIPRIVELINLYIHDALWAKTKGGI